MSPISLTAFFDELEKIGATPSIQEKQYKRLWGKKIIVPEPRRVRNDPPTMVPNYYASSFSGQGGNINSELLASLPGAQPLNA